MSAIGVSELWRCVHSEEVRASVSKFCYPFIGFYRFLSVFSGTREGSDLCEWVLIKMKSKIVRRGLVGLFVASLLGSSLALGEGVPASAADYSESPITVGDFDWRVTNDAFGIDEVEVSGVGLDDGMDATSFSLARAGETLVVLECDAGEMELEDPLISGIDSRVTCDNFSTTKASLPSDVDVHAYIDIFDEGDLSRTVIAVENTGVSAISIDFEIDFNFGEGFTLGEDSSFPEQSGFSISSGLDEDTLPVAVAVGNIPLAEVTEDANDDFVVLRTAYELAAGTKLTVAYFHRVLDPDVESDRDIIPARLASAALDEFSSFSGRLNLGLINPADSVLGWSDMPSRSTAVGDVSGAVRYDTGGPFGDPVMFLSEDAFHFDDAGQHRSLDADFPINFYGTKADGLCISTNGYVVPVAGEDDYSECGSGESYDESVAELASRETTSLIAVLAADLEILDCPTNSDGLESLYFDGFGYPCSVYFDGEATIDGKDAVVVTWYRVRTHGSDAPSAASNTFQLVLIKGDGGDSTVGWDFDVEFNYGTMQDGDAGYDINNPSSSCTGFSTDCRWGVGWAEWDSSTSQVTQSAELFPSTVASQLTDGGSSPLVCRSLNSGVAGRYSFSMESGVTVGFSLPDMSMSACLVTVAGVPGIYLSVAGPVGRSVWDSPVYYGSDRVAASSTYLLTVAPVPSSSRSTVSLAEGELPLNGSLEAMVRLPVLAPGTYNVRMEGTHRNGSTLQLTSVITVGPSGEFTSIGPNIPVIK